MEGTKGEMQGEGGKEEEELFFVVHFHSQTKDRRDGGRACSGCPSVVGKVVYASKVPPPAPPI